MTRTLANLICQPQRNTGRCAIVTPESRWTWGELSEEVAKAGETFAGMGGQRVGVLHDASASSWAALAALEFLAADVFLLDATLPAFETQRLATEFQLAAAIRPQGRNCDTPWQLDSIGSSPGSGEGVVTILTSGTSSRPKAARHTWTSLCRPVRKSTEAEPLAWLLTYRPHLYAGLQVCLQCFASGAKLVNPGANASVDRVVEMIIREQVACVSATPSYWRQLLVRSAPTDLQKLQLQQITLGGELVDQQVLDMLKGAFPEARIVHIYATTELGRCFSVTDGRAGFPSRFLNTVSNDGVELRIGEGELQVRSANAMGGYDPLSGIANQRSDWFATGDLVRCEGDRCYFVGRKSDIINVGGNKVSPQEVEQVLRSVPGVADVRVYAKASSMVGQLVAVQIVPLCAQDAETVRAAVVDAGLRQLSPPQRPRLVEIVERIELSDAGKMRRN